MKPKYVYKPAQYFAITFLITWFSWFITAYFSYQMNDSFNYRVGGWSKFGIIRADYLVFMTLGLLAPCGTALWMIFSSKNESLRKDFINKLVNFRLIKFPSILMALLIMPIAIVISILISLMFGQSINQFQLAKVFSFSTGAVPVLFSLLLAPLFEELGWRGYGMDSLSSKFNYFKATLIFATLWAFWHFPLFFINNYYHNELLRANIFFAINFMISVFPFAFIINWVWQKNRKSILSVVLFHFAANISSEIFQMSQITKCIETLVLLVIAAIIVLQNKKMFFNNERTIN